MRMLLQHKEETEDTGYSMEEVTLSGGNDLSLGYTKAFFHIFDELQSLQLVRMKEPRNLLSGSTCEEQGWESQLLSGAPHLACLHLSELWFDLGGWGDFAQRDGAQVSKALCLRALKVFRLCGALQASELVNWYEDFASGAEAIRGCTVKRKMELLPAADKPTDGEVDFSKILAL
ncbi:hypothetical protein JCM10450v2_006347 [Rhodotorula kratochvilovae]